MIVEMDAPEPEAVRRARAQVRGLGIACAVILVVGLLGLTVVGKSPRPSKQALSVVLSAASRTSGASTARFAVASQVTVQGHSVPGSTADGVMKFADPKWASATLHLASLNFDIITDGKTEYIKLPASGALRTRTPWVGVDISALAGAGQLGSVGGPTLPGGGDPTATLEGLKAVGVVKSAAAGGKAQVRGTSTRVYHLVLDGTAFKQKVVDMAKATGLPSAGAAALEFKDPLVDLYLDDQGYVRRMVTTVEMKFSGGSNSATLTNATQLDLFDFGTPVHVQTPPANQVTRVGSLAELSSYLTTGR